MECPKCGGPLTERIGKILQPLPFVSDETRLRKRRWTKRTYLFKCEKCGRTFARQLTLKEVEVLG